MSFRNEVSSLPSAGGSLLDRRNFMKLSGGCAALGTTSLLSQILSLQLTSVAMADSGGGSGYKALVCVFFNGGMDTFNLLVPYDQPQYDEYASTRSALALSRSSVLPIDGGDQRQYGVHPAMPELQALYNNGKLGFVANVGSLVYPTTKANYSTVKKPLGLFSHSDLIQHWQTAVPQSRSQVTGWGGRMADMLTAQYAASSNISMNVALGSLNIFQTGTDVVPYVVADTGATTLSGYTGTAKYDLIHRDVINSIYPSTSDSQLGTIYSDLLQRTLAKSKRVSVDAADGFNSATGAALTTDRFQPIIDSTTVSSSTKSLARNLRMVAKVIRERATFAQGRQIFFVSLGGWDHHSGLLTNQASMFPGVSQSLAAFYETTVDLNVAECVTTFTASDFARTLTLNASDGSDHAWGGNHIVMGGSVIGGKVYGKYPTSLGLGAINSLDLGSGRLIPETSVDVYNAELATWFGISNDSQLEGILPNIRNFYGAASSSRPLGFLPAS